MPPESTPPNLELLQRWLQAVITHPGGLEEGALGSGVPLAFVAIEDIIPSSSKQTSAERLAVYASAYYLRLVDCLREFFPCLRDAMGDEVFDEFALAYLQRHPSPSYTLHHLADQFANFLSQTKPSAGWEEFFVDLARLEHAIEVVFDAEGPEELSPLGRGESVVLTSQSILSFIPGFQLLKFSYPVSSYYTAWKHGERPPLPVPQAHFIALFRRDYIVRRHELTLVQHSLLALLQSGMTLEQSLAQIATQALMEDQTVDDLAAALRDWFEVWARAGMFSTP